MDTKQLQQGLHQAFFTEQHRIVFWYDAEQSFREELDQLELPGIQVLDMAQEASLALKFRLELDDPQGKYLLYFPSAEPDIKEDWLLDIKLYSRSFYADRISLIFNELGLSQQSLRKHLANRQRFLASKNRIAALKKVVAVDADSEQLDLTMIAITLGAPGSDIATLLFTLGEQAAAYDLGLETNPPAIEELIKYDLLPALLRALQNEVGYPVSAEELSGEHTFSLGQLMIRLLTTGFCESVGDIPAWAKSIAIPSAGARATSRALLSRWRDSSRFYPAYDTISHWVASALRIQQKLSELPLPTLSNIATFEAAEKQVVVELCHAIPQAGAIDLATLEQIISNRLDGYWASRHKDDQTRKKYRLIYAALSAAIDLFGLRHSYAAGFHYPSCEAIYQAYEKELYRFDTAYRHYMTAARKAHIDLLRELDSAVEACYADWYIAQLSRSWSDKLEAEDRLAHWHMSGTPGQQQFYRHWVQPQFGGSRNKRVAVIISDAFRYEAAVELRERIDAKRYSQAKLSSQLGVLPSYTTLGMASLLPHKSLDYREGAGDEVLADGQSTKSTAARNKVLTAHGGIAVSAEDVKTWSREAGREALKDQQLVYVYHNVVDARGDSVATESETFDAVEQAIEELDEMARKILMHFNTSTVIITADHGFLFQQSKPNSVDKTELTDVPGNIIKSKKRYVIGPSLPTNKEVWHGNTKHTAGTSIDTEFWIPKGANRFHFVGGARFVHGGAMPQEIVVPVLTVNQLRGEKAERRSMRKVEVISARSSLKMVNNIQRFDLLQTEAVSDRVMPVTLSVGIYDGDQLISSEETVTFDCSTDSMSERTRQVRLSLQGSDFDRKRDYFLVLKDKDLKTETERYRVIIDLAITNDF
jgi:uncharacterized protein (TIGR02687 family)